MGLWIAENDLQVKLILLLYTSVWSIIHLFLVDIYDLYNIVWYQTSENRKELEAEKLRTLKYS